MVSVWILCQHMPLGCRTSRPIYRVTLRYTQNTRQPQRGLPSVHMFRRHAHSSYNSYLVVAWDKKKTRHKTKEKKQ